MPPRPQLVVIGSGFIGLAHALMARRAGYEVDVYERHGRPLGASVRNFGTIWPIGCMPGPEREQGLFGAAFWKELAREIGIWHDPCGSLSLAYRDSSWSVLREFAASNGADGDFEVLDAATALRRFPAVRPEGLRGALFSPHEVTLHTPTAVPALIVYLQSIGVRFHFHAPVAAVGESGITLAGGEARGFDRLLIAAGEEMRLFFPGAVGAAGLVPCRLQMMRTVAQPEDWRPGAICTSDLTLCHYPAFRDCPSLPGLDAELARDLPSHRRHGIHVIAARHGDGSLTIGDSHEYGEDLDPASNPEVDALILEALDGFLPLPDPRIAARWQGTYLKSTRGQTQVVLEPAPRVTMVTAMGGLGMTLGWGLARRKVEAWQNEDN